MNGPLRAPTRRYRSQNARTAATSCVFGPVVVGVGRDVVVGPLLLAGAEDDVVMVGVLRLPDPEHAASTRAAVALSTAMRVVMERAVRIRVMPQISALAGRNGTKNSRQRQKSARDVCTDRC